jgi:hypothetical protein
VVGWHPFVVILPGDLILYGRFIHMFGLIRDGIDAGGVPFLMMSTALLPMAWPWWLARRALRQGAAQSYAVHLAAALVVCGVLSWMLWPFLFGDGLKQGSTASLIFLVAPIYGFLALLVAYALAWGWVRFFWAKRVWGQVPLWARCLGHLPVVFMGVLLVGITLISVQLLRLNLLRL